MGNHDNGMAFLMEFIKEIHNFRIVSLVLTSRRLIEDQNIGLGVAFAGTALAIAIIIAATILS